MLLGVDVGGTFTDAVLVAPESSGTGIYTAKVPTTPDEQSRGVLTAVRAVLASAGAQPGQVERFAHGMTVATNALLEGRAARTALIATEGFTDVVELGRQARAHLYRLCESGPAPLVPTELRFAAPERMTPDGPLRVLDPCEARALVERTAQAPGIESVAVVLLHSYAHPEHERLLGELLAARLPGVHVSLSHELVGTFREYERAATTEIDAALSPLVGTYLRRLGQEADALGLTRPAVMQSSGGLTDAEGAAAHAARTALSGPAGGVRGALALARLAGERNVLCFDMGGTSCDVCLIADGRVAETAQGAVAGRPLALAMLDIHTVGAGGGSIAWRDPGGALRVGPHSAGADPGPACYGRGGRQPTVTDANLLLGRLPADAPLAGGLQLDRNAAERAIAGLAAQLGLAEEAGPTGETDETGASPPATSRPRLADATRRCAEGIVRVAEAQMLGALRAITVERGIDPRGFALMPFGGAGPLHAAALARELGMRRILCPRASGVLCALGLAAAAPRRDAARTVMLTGETLNAERLAAEREELVARACAHLGEPARRVGVRYELRYHGQSFELAIEEEGTEEEEEEEWKEGKGKEGKEEERKAPPSPDALREAFARAHEQRYGYRDGGVEVELVTIRVSAWGAAPRLRLAGSDGEPAPGTMIEGPAVCALPGSALYVPDGWSGEVDAYGSVRLYDEAAGA
jgi:N-methylhydantoinase A